MIRRPPRSTLFPYTRSSDLLRTRHPAEGHPAHPFRHVRKASRSEEHTSELQSHSDLVCRLLLEKKKTKIQGTERLRALATALEGDQHQVRAEYGTGDQSTHA